MKNKQRRRRRKHVRQKPARAKAADTPLGGGGGHQPVPPLQGDPATCPHGLRRPAWMDLPDPAPAEWRWGFGSS